MPTEELTQESNNGRAPDCIPCAEGVLLRDHDRCAFFRPADLRVFALDIPAGWSTAETLRHVHADSTLRIPESPSRRDAILPILSNPPAISRRLIGSAGAHLHRLTLHVSNACTPTCEYCYSDSPDHGHDQEPMRPATVRTVLERVLELYSGITEIQFFGGEPLLHTETIDLVGEILLRAVEKKALGAMPRMVAATNGTWTDGAALSTLKRWKMGLTLSWDGPRRIGHPRRPAEFGQGSYEVAAASVERLRRYGIPFEIECTYNGYHRRDGISLVDLMHFFHDQTGKSVVRIVPAFLPQPGNCQFQPLGAFVEMASLTDEYRKATGVSITNMMRGAGPVLEFALRAARRLATRNRSGSSCPAFQSQLAIATDGSVYPCFMLVGDAAYYMGNLLDGDFPGQASATVLALYDGEMASREQFWYSCLLEDCPAGESLMTGSLAGNAFAPIAEAIAQESILAFASGSAR